MENNKSNSTIEDLYENKIISIMNQTIYSYTEAENKLKQYNYNHINVIKEYMGITEKKAPHTKVTSLNQEIYKQIRRHIDITDYNEKHPLNLDHIKTNLLEEELKHNKI
jgi:hypothetical protein